MYVKRTQVVNYGPISHLDIEFPFDDGIPKPVVIVGENGSGKSILLSHVVNGLACAQSAVYPDTAEVEQNRVYKIRSGSYIKSGEESYYARVDYENDLFVEELWMRRPKRVYSNAPSGIRMPHIRRLWDTLEPNDRDRFDSNMTRKKMVQEHYSKNSVLYFPPNRFEDPAWLNVANLRAHAEYVDRLHLEGHTIRKLFNYSPLHDNQNWLFDVIYDRAVFEARTATVPVPVSDSNRSSNVVSLPVFAGHAGDATSVYDSALQVVRSVISGGSDTRFGIGRRHSRIVSIVGASGQIVPNIFQLSSGETSLLNLFLSILRDFDLCDVSFSSAESVRGLVVVDEIDLHLHAIHQYEVLPRLMRMFPNVQFVITTHSPLLVLGLNAVLGEDGFALYRLPSGARINPEEFGEFRSAYQSFTETSRFSDDMREAIERAQKPVLYVEGDTDLKYLQSAGDLLERRDLLDRVQVISSGGSGNLKKLWGGRRLWADGVISHKVILLFDCDAHVTRCDSGNFFRRIIPRQDDHPLHKGVENMFTKQTLEKALRYKSEFIDVDNEHTKTERGKSVMVPEKWTVNDDEKSNLCDWLCEYGTEQDFRHFRLVFDMLEEVVGPELTGVDG